MLFVVLSGATLADDIKLDYSGFVRIVGGYLDEKYANYEGYHNQFSLTEDSLVGLQAELEFTDKLSVTAQLLGHSGDDRDSGVEWFYVTYEPIEKLQIKLGRMRTPFFSLSDVIDVGFAYPYVMPPQQVYNGFLFDQYDGVNLAYDTDIHNFRLRLETYIGQFDGDSTVADDTAATEVRDMFGLIGKLGYDNLELRVAYFTGDIDVEVASLNGLSAILNQQGFYKTAATLNTKGRPDVYQYSLAYDGLRYFAKAEFTQIKATFFTAPETKSHYFTAGINLSPVTLHITKAMSSVEYSVPVSEIPLGVHPSLDFLAQSYQTLYSSLPRDDLNSLSAGIRWDVKYDLALKAEVTKLDGDAGERAFFEITDTAQFDRNAVLYMFALEWVF